MLVTRCVFVKLTGAETADQIIDVLSVIHRTTKILSDCDIFLEKPDIPSYRRLTLVYVHQTFFNVLRQGDGRRFSCFEFDVDNVLAGVCADIIGDDSCQDADLFAGALY